MTVAAILKHKGHDVVAARPTDSVAAVVALLSSRGFGAVLVRDDADQVLGIVSERDIMHGLARHGADTLAMTAAQLMTRDLVTITPATTVEQAMELMTNQRLRHLPVLDRGRLAGIISIGDVVKSRLQQQAHEVDSLKAYVAGAA
jgi:CBS domain-containing protein